ncbi:hypothetical protein CK247_20000, partial [Klebsiella pneumoniae]
AVGQKASQALKTVTGTAAKVQRNPVIAHLLRAGNDDRRPPQEPDTQPEKSKARSRPSMTPPSGKKPARR